ncbi:pheromone A receptor-domain-containing protein [Rhizophagus diaphanus]|nr:pheromone A receptor-domain-containing protein [Rhizophagus diaphanus] [Rhizophagus sp. MUCL 43196]
MGDLMFTISTGLAVILCIIPGIFHLQTRNYGAIFMTMWVFIANFITFVNSILWPDYEILEDKAEIWCLVFASPFYLAAGFGLLGSATCTIYTMYSYVASPIILTIQVKKRQALIAFVITVVIPFILTGLSYIIQTAKYSIRPILGCANVHQQNWFFFVVNNMWPPIIAIVGCYYAGLTSYAIIKKRIEIKSLLAYNESGINTSYYYRLVLFCVTYLIFALPAALLNTFSNLLEGFVPFDMSERNWHSITRFPGENHGVTFVDYAKPLSGFILFIFFGTGQEAVLTYKKWLVAAKLDKIFCCLFPSNIDDQSRNNSNINGNIGTLRSFQGQSSFGKHSVPRTPRTPRTPRSPRSRQSISDDSPKIITPPPKAMIDKEKKSGMKNILYLTGHRTPSEQAAFDLTSGLRMNIDGIETRTVINEVDEDLHERPAPAYHHRGIQETLEIDVDNDDFGVNRYVEDDVNDDFGTNRYIEDDDNFGTNRYIEGDDDLALEYSTPLPSQPQMSFGGGSVSHINHLLAVYDETVPAINVTPSSPLPNQQTYAMVRVHPTDTFVANGIDDVIEEYSPSRNTGNQSQRSSYSETGIAL